MKARHNAFYRNELKYCLDILIHILTVDECVDEMLTATNSSISLPPPPSSLPLSLFLSIAPSMSQIAIEPKKRRFHPKKDLEILNTHINEPTAQIFTFSIELLFYSFPS